MRVVGGLEAGAVRVSGRRMALVLAAAMCLGLVSAAAAWGAGGLSRPTGTAACISADGSGGACETGAVGDSTGIAISPDGRSVYVASYRKNIFSIFDRDPATGALVQKPGAAGCISEDVSGCAEPIGLDEPQEVVVSPDGKNVYAIGEDSSTVAIFNRDANGALTQTAGAACVTGGHEDGCQRVSGLRSPVSLAISPDGTSIYVGGLPGSLVTLTRDPQTGALTQKPGAAGCISIKPLRGCKLVEDIVAPVGLLVSPDGKNVYVGAGRASTGIVFAFDRNRKTGALTRQSGADACFESSTGADSCRLDVALGGGLYGAAISPDGRSVYFSNEYGNGGLSIFRRNPRSGALTRRRGKAACITTTGSKGACQKLAALGGLSAIRVSPDGRNVYLSTLARKTVLTFDRNPATGALRHPKGAAGCLSGPPTEKGCGGYRGLGLLGGLVISPDGANLYAPMLSPGGVSVFDRASH